MFDNPDFDKYTYEDIPLNEDCYLVDEKYAAEYEAMYLGVFEDGKWEPIGYVSYVAAIVVHENSVELSWYPNIHDRFHEMSILLPKSKIRQCVGCWRWDWKPTIFVDSNWLDNLYKKSFSVFGVVDAIGVKKAIRDEQLSREKLIALKSKIDSLSSEYPEISFISFADSILIKSNWTVGSVNDDLKYTYKPELFIEVAKEFQKIFQETLNLGCYTILAQGYNEYYDDNLLHISESKNHISLNSLGVPFAQLLSIEDSIRKAIKKEIHPASEIYLDQTFYHSLRFKIEFEKGKRPKAEYQPVMSKKPASYFYSDLGTIFNNLEKVKK
ncbi:MAG: hypothetical protein DRQ64_08480 [Gammaproteobacteria bacterium]|nr:MAG: hypothetical protein DRQ64_08480 [Gammaproteobacteria bacterium]